MVSLGLILITMGGGIIGGIREVSYVTHFEVILNGNSDKVTFQLPRSYCQWLCLNRRESESTELALGPLHLMLLVNW